MSAKTILLETPLSVFLSNEAQAALISGETSEHEEELAKGKEFFGVEDLTKTGKFSLRLENMIWGLYEKLEIPKSPLKMKAHERFLQDVAAELKNTLDTEDLPKLTAAGILAVRDLITDESKFAALTLPFEFTLESGEVRTIPLPSVNIFSNNEFVSALDTVFQEA